ncbi:DUF4102 domain-containing protein [Nostoc sp. MG11]|uniref:DUF4102 domain-containing protein n=1 Tax=Nostoc sp. MG11 TaxID=2721166 RepID=UPI0018670C3A|nr:DUF4102 domain-containing protein [Nostoc sp. MG11]
MKQTTLFDLEAFTKSSIPVYDPFWDELDAPQQSHSVGGQTRDSESAYKSVGEQVRSDTLKSAPQHDTHWIEKYWVERCSNKYWYYRYCWMQGRKIHRCYLGSVRSRQAQHGKEMVEIAISDGRSPVEIEKLIRQQRDQGAREQLRL